jgi:hypothetical protein
MNRKQLREKISETLKVLKAAGCTASPQFRLEWKRFKPTWLVAARSGDEKQMELVYGALKKLMDEELERMRIDKPTKEKSDGEEKEA